jgi:septal ring factor EnvC (AmiA/AmiB activator)
VRSTIFAVWLLLIVSIVVPAKPCFCQDIGRFPPLPNQTGPVDPDQEKRAHELAKKINQERQAQLKRDTDTLLKLATELKQYVDKSNENTLSVDVIQKADQIDKLARSIKDKMKGN